jgi:hypothetical protein
MMAADAMPERRSLVFFTMLSIDAIHLNFRRKIRTLGNLFRIEWTGTEAIQTGVIFPTGQS